MSKTLEEKNSYQKYWWAKQPIAKRREIVFKTKSSRDSAYARLMTDPVRHEAKKKYRREYYKNNRVALLKYEREIGQELRTLCLNHYGWICKCCGEDEPRFLALDHINNDGREHRKRCKGSGVSLYRDLIKAGFPDYIQTLCCNCNLGKLWNKGICPHQQQSIAFQHD